MQHLYTSNISRHNEKKSVLNRLSYSAIILAVALALLHSSAVLAGSSVKNAEQQVAQNSEEYKAKVSINREEMTAEKKSKLPAKDSKIGAFSMEDEAREGFYGDGEYTE